MSCCYLTGSYMLSCAARREAYIPSGFEFDEYCKSSRFSLCPFYDQDRSHEAAPRMDPQVAATVRSASDPDTTTAAGRFNRERRTRYDGDPH